MSSDLPGTFDSGDHDAILAQFAGLYNVDLDEAKSWLSESNWDLGAASAAYQTYIDGHGSNEDDEDEEDEGDETVNHRGGRTLAGGNASGPVETRSGAKASASSSKSTAPGKKIATLGDIGSGQAPQDHNDDSDDDQDFFAGGEKSGLAVQNPDDLKRKILDKARRGGARPGGDEPEPKVSNFRGTAHTLGGDDVPSEVVEDPEANIPRPPARAERRLHFWSNGFSVDDGDLYDTNDPQNAHILQMIRSGRAPLDIMNVSRDQEVDVKVEQHDGPYVAPKKKANPFAGSGQRLGSPVPGVVGAGFAASSSTPAPSMPAAGVSGGSSAAAVSLDTSQPTISVQIRLGDGTRLVSRFNPTHTISDVYAFVDASSPESAARPYALMTTFPSKELDQRAATIGDTAELKKGGAIVQKWL